MRTIQQALACVVMLVATTGHSQAAGIVVFDQEPSDDYVVYDGVGYTVVPYPGEILDMAFDPTDGVLYSVNNNGDVYRADASSNYLSPQLFITGVLDTLGQGVFNQNINLTAYGGLLAIMNPNPNQYHIYDGPNYVGSGWTTEQTILDISFDPTNGDLYIMTAGATSDIDDVFRHKHDSASNYLGTAELFIEDARFNYAGSGQDINMTVYGGVVATTYGFSSAYLIHDETGYLGAGVLTSAGPIHDLSFDNNGDLYIQVGSVGDIYRADSASNYLNPGYFIDSNTASGPGSGFDLNLAAYSANAVLPGDFDFDGDVDGRDFLEWQRNPSVGNLTDWQDQYGGTPLLSAVPEPSTLLLLLGFMWPVLRR